MKIGPMVKGFLTFIPGMQRLMPKREVGGETASASYCYGVWLKHLTLLRANGMQSIPDSIAELGPGDSLGVGLAALLSGVNNYYALDVVRHSSPVTNIRIFDELVPLFKSRAARPTKGWPDFDEYLNKDLFPSHILDDKLLESSLSESRIQSIRKTLENPYHHSEEISIKYMVPWSDSRVIVENSVDVILSHSVLEHVVDLEGTYRALYAWLKPKGMMSHQIDFKSHGITDVWNGYRAYPEMVWKLILGKRPYLINRQPCSAHEKLAIKNGFNIVFNLKNHRSDGIRRSELSSIWEDISDDDLTCSGAFIQAMK